MSTARLWLSVCAITAILFSGSAGMAAERAIFPGENWAVKTPEQVGMDVAGLRRFSDLVGGRGCVVRHGCMVYTWGNAAKRGDVASACKPWFSHFLFKAIDTIIPLPKEIQAVTEPVPLDGFRIAAADDERSQIGAAEINQRIVSLGGQPLPVSRLDGELPKGKAARGVAERASAKLTAFIRRLNSLLPPDIAICIRESERKHLELVRRAWGQRSFYLYYEYAFWKGWRPDFLTTPLMTRSLYYPAYNDILFGNVSGSGWRELTQLCGVECAWNVNRPGAMDFNSAAWHDWGTTVEVPRARRAFAQRACRFWFGEQAGPLMAPAFAENISRYFICFPEQVLDQVRLSDPVATMAEQARAASRAAESLDKLWTLQQQSPVLSGDEYGYFLNLYQMTHAARILAGHQAAIMAARRAIQQGNRSEAQHQLALAGRLLDQETTAWSALNKQIPQRQRLAAPTRKTSTAGLLSTLDPRELRQEIVDLTASLDERIAAHTIPTWFRRDCRKRDLVAVRATQPMTIDGRLEETVWKNAPRVEHFVDWRQLRLESLETVARLAYDDDNLYVAIECFDPDPAAITTAMQGADQYRLCDSVEVLVAPRGAKSVFAHWIVDSKGTVFDARSGKTSDGRIKYMPEWDSGAQVKVSRAADHWTVELAIRRADTGVRLEPGTTAPRRWPCRLISARSIRRS